MSFLSKIFGKKTLNPDDLDAVIRAYGKVLENSSSVSRNITELPLAKHHIAAALIKAIKLTPPGPQREQLKTSFVILGDFQDLENCRENGIDPMKLGLAESEKLLAALESAGV